MKKIVTICLVLLLTIVLCGCDSKGKAYDEAKRLFEAGEYEEAKDKFSELGEYKDSAEMVNEMDYKIAERYVGEEKYEEAQAIYKALGDYKDSVELVDKMTVLRNPLLGEWTISLFKVDDIDYAKTLGANGTIVFKEDNTYELKYGVTSTASIESVTGTWEELDEDASVKIKGIMEDIGVDFESIDKLIGYKIEGFGIGSYVHFKEDSEAYVIMGATDDTVLILLFMR